MVTPERRYCVIAVDDEEHNLDVIRRFLRKQYDVLTFVRSADALEALATREVHAVISDLRMPGMSGIDFLERVRELSPRTQRIILSAYGDTADLRDAMARGSVYTYLLKPISAPDLTRALEEALSRLQPPEIFYLNAQEDVARALTDVLAPLGNPLRPYDEGRLERGVVFLDLDQPGACVDDVLVATKQRGGAVVLLATEPLLADARRWAQRGAVAILRKPIVAEDVRHVVEDVLERRRSSGDAGERWSGYYRVSR